MGVWRELRRLKDEAGTLEQLEGVVLAAYEAADVGNWYEYLTVHVQGGADVNRKAQPLRTYYMEPVNVETGEVKQNKLN